MVTIRAIELTKEQFQEKEKAVTTLLKPLNGFSSPSYQLKGIETVNDLFLLLEPKELKFKEVIKDLNIEFQDLNINIIKREEI